MVSGAQGRPRRGRVANAASLSLAAGCQPARATFGLRPGRVGEDAANYGTKLNEKIADLHNVIESVDRRPTDQTSRSSTNSTPAAGAAAEAAHRRAQLQPAHPTVRPGPDQLLCRVTGSGRPGRKINGCAGRSLN